MKFKKSALVKAFEEESFSCCIIGHICADVMDDEAIHDADVQQFLVEWTKKGGVLILQGEGALLNILAHCFGTSWIFVRILFTESNFDIFFKAQSMPIIIVCLPKHSDTNLL